MILSKCAVCERKQSRTIKGQKAVELLSSLGINTFLIKIPWEVPLLL